MSRRRSYACAASLAVLIACADSADVLSTPEPLTPVEVSPGMFRLTFDPLPDYVRGFTPTGDTVIVRATRGGVLGTGDSLWRMLSLPMDGVGGSRERATIYRLATERPLADLAFNTAGRLLVSWQRGNDRSFDGPMGCFDQPYIHVWRYNIIRLPVEDGAALSDLPKWSVATPTVDTAHFDPQTDITWGMRFIPADSEVIRGANPFGPAEIPGVSRAVYSDGDALWRIDLTSASASRDSLGPGMFPAVSPDGQRLAFVRPAGLDSSFTADTSLRLLFKCIQHMWTMRTTGFTTSVVSLASGDTVQQIDGSDPAFDPTSTRVVVRRNSGLVIVDLTSGAETAVSGTAGAFSPAFSPSGKYLAFSRKAGSNIDVYYAVLQ